MSKCSRQKFDFQKQVSVLLEEVPAHHLPRFLAIMQCRVECRRPSTVHPFFFPARGRSLNNDDDQNDARRTSNLNLLKTHSVGFLDVTRDPLHFFHTFFNCIVVK